MAEIATPDPEFEALLRYIQESRGVDFRGYKRTSLKRRITLRMTATRAASFSEYQAQLEVDPAEFAELLDTILINVTSFFRDPEAWEALRTAVIPQIVARNREVRPIRVWSVGCAGGQEAYSIAMLLAEALGAQAFSQRVKIYATDLDENALRAARQASYAARDVESVPPNLLSKYFDRVGNQYVFSRELRKAVIFGLHNVVRDAPISRIDLIVCRNLLIYLQAETQDIVFPRLHYALASEGFLFLGKAETQLARSPLFRAVDMKRRIFAKVAQGWGRANSEGALVAREHRGEHLTARDRLLEAVLDQASTAYLGVDELGAVILANAAARQLLNIGESDIGRPFHDLPISYRPVELRAPIDEALQEGRAFRTEHQEFYRSKSDVIRLSIDVRPLQRPDGTSYAALIAFNNTTQLYSLQQDLETAQEKLENSTQELQSANEELETTNEELQSTNEELETTNEELQSTNEELETINEEVRSSNEAMETTNEELNLQAEQSTGHRTYLELVLRGMNIGLVVISENHTIQSWNCWCENTWGLRAEEVVGAGFESLDIGVPVHLLRDALNAVQSGAEAVAERTLEGLDRRGRPILCRVRIAPVSSEDLATAGLVIAFEDITEERKREEYTRYLGRIMGRALNEIYFLDPDTLRFILANHGAEVKLETNSQQLARMTLADVIPGASLAALKQFFKPLITGGKSEIVFETNVRSTEGRTYPAEIFMQYFGDEAPRILVAIVHDITERASLAAE